jgi:translation initiation factor IF-3
MDYGRYKFEALKKDKESRREHNVITVKEMKLRPKISEHDFQTKFGSVRHFLEEGDKVKLTIMFRGREMVHQEYGRRLLDRIADELQETATIERTPIVEGRNMTMILSPVAKRHPKGENRENSRRSQAPGREAAPVRAPATEQNSNAEDSNA